MSACPHENFFWLASAADSAKPGIPVCTACTRKIEDAGYLAANTCRHCARLVPPIERRMDCPQRRKTEPSGRAGSRPHEFPCG